MKNERYLFRGMRADIREWVEGDLIQLDHQICIAEKTGWATEFSRGILELQCIEVIPGTVGQWSGITDKNGVKVFDGDKIHTGDEEGSDEYSLVIYNAEQARFQCDLYGHKISHNEGGGEEYGNSIELIDENNLDMEFLSDCKVIGTIHDHLKQSI